MDWKLLIAELVDSFGMSQPQIAEACDCAQTTISALATGKTLDPKHSTGETLKDLLRAKRASRAAPDEPSDQATPAAAATSLRADHDTGERRRTTDQAAAAGG